MPADRRDTELTVQPVKPAPAAALDEDAALPGSLLGGYRLGREIGRGASGRVFEAEHPRTGEVVAVKILSAAAARVGPVADRFLAAARAVQAIDHAHLVRLREVAIGPGGRPFVVMDRLQGETLADLLARGPLPLAEALPLALQIRDGLAALHRQGVVHRDLKPANVIVVRGANGRPHARIVDFGLARTGEPERLEPGVFVGTPLYVSPEQARGDAALDGRSDLYALGAVLYEMLCGRPPFTGDPQALLALHQVAKPDLPSRFVTLPPALERLVMKCLAKSPDERPPTVEAFASELQPILEAHRAHARAEGIEAGVDLPAGAGDRNTPSKASSLGVEVSPGALAGQGEVSRPRRGRGAMRTATSLAKVAGGVAATVVVAWFVVRFTVTPDEMAGPVLLRVSSDPPGAQIVADAPGLRASGLAPLEVKVPRGLEVRLTAQLDGYAEAQLVHRTQDAGAVTIRLMHAAGARDAWGRPVDPRRARAPARGVTPD